MTSTPASQQQFCVRWNSHLGSLGAAFPQLLAGQRFVDVTLACEGHQLHCHRLVLAACSSYFESLLSENPCKHPIIIMPHDIKLWEIQALVDFMYKGEVNVSQAGLPDLLRCAEVLQIRGLCGTDAALNLNSVNSGTTTPASSSSQSQQAQQQNKELSPNNNIPSSPNTTSPPLPQVTSQQQQQQITSTTSAGGVCTSSSTLSSSLSTSSPPSSSSSPSTGATAGSDISPATLPVSFSSSNNNTSSAANNSVNPRTSTTNNDNVNNISSMQQQKFTNGPITNATTEYANRNNQQQQQNIRNQIVANGTKRSLASQDISEFSTTSSNNANNKTNNNQQYITSTPNNTVTPKLEPIDDSMEDDIDEDSSIPLSKITKEEYMENSTKPGNEKQLHHQTQTQQHLIEYLDEQFVDDVAYKHNVNDTDNNNTDNESIKNLQCSNETRPILIDHDYEEEYNCNNNNNNNNDNINSNNNKIDKTNNDNAGIIMDTVIDIVVDDDDNNGKIQEIVVENGKIVQEKQKVGEENSVAIDEKTITISESINQQDHHHHHRYQENNNNATEITAIPASISLDNSRKRLNSTTVQDNQENCKKVAIGTQTSRTSSPASTISSLSSVNSPNISNINNNNNNNNGNATNNNNNNLGKIRVKSAENLYANTNNYNISSDYEDIMNEEDMMSQQLPPSLKFNKDEMTIFVKKPNQSSLINGSSSSGGGGNHYKNFASQQLRQHQKQQQQQQITTTHSTTNGPMIHTVRSLASQQHQSSPGNPSTIGGGSSVRNVRTGNGITTIRTSNRIRNMRANGTLIGILTSNGSSPVASPEISDENSNRSIPSSIYYDPNDIGQTATIKTEIDIADDQEQDLNSNYENIVCSPNVHDYSNYNNDEEYDYDEYDEEQSHHNHHHQHQIQNIKIINRMERTRYHHHRHHHHHHHQDHNVEEQLSYDDIRLVEETTYGNSPELSSPLPSSSSSLNQQMIINSGSNISTIIIPSIGSYATSTSSSGGVGSSSITVGNTLLSSNDDDGGGTRISGRSNVLKNAYLAIYNKTNGKYHEIVGPVTVENINNDVNLSSAAAVAAATPSSSTIRYQQSSSGRTQEQIMDINNGIKHHNMKHYKIDHQQQQLQQHLRPSSPNPSPSAVVLRNPRSNQPRSYSTEALYAALMDVKSGESIYRASQLHKVPRKTLRNWMKRWHIKSAFPMPRQLQQAAEKKKLKQMQHKMEKYKIKENCV